MKMFKVTAKCGHVGRNHYVVKNFPVQASNGREAAKIARDLPRVKHHHKDAIINVEEITFSEYYLLIQQNNSSTGEPAGWWYRTASGDMLFAF